MSATFCDRGAALARLQLVTGKVVTGSPSYPLPVHHQSKELKDVLSYDRDRANKSFTEIKQHYSEDSIVSNLLLFSLYFFHLLLFQQQKQKRLTNLHPHLRKRHPASLEQQHVSSTIHTLTINNVCFHSSGNIHCGNALYGM
jgi:hypothetical protein